MGFAICINCKFAKQDLVASSKLDAQNEFEKKKTETKCKDTI